MTESLQQIARQLVDGGKGLLAADESISTIKKRFDTIGLASTPDSRRDYREMLFRSNPAMHDYISGVILFDETIRQNARDGTPFTELIAAAGSLPGIKVDIGAQPLALFPGETVTEGLDGLRDRLREYRTLGARFAKWRGVIGIGPNIPTDGAIAANADALARYAALCQEADIVPIVEPEVLMDGPIATHDIETCYRVTETTLNAVFDALTLARVDLTAMILKPNMVVPGRDFKTPVHSDEVARRTVDVFHATVPTSVPGIAFLSGGQPDILATENLSAINRIPDLPWKITFSFGRALQAAALELWDGKDENIAAGQLAFLHRCRMNSLAALGKWSPDLEDDAP